MQCDLLKDALKKSDSRSDRRELAQRAIAEKQASIWYSYLWIRELL